MALSFGSAQKDVSPAAESPRLKRKRTSRACDYCRLHRIRCEYSSSTDGVADDPCRHCKDFGLACERVAPAPRHFRRPVNRKFTTLAGYSPSQSTSTLDVGDGHAQGQGLEPGYLGPSNLIQLVRDCMGSSDDGRSLQQFDDRHDIYRDAIDSHRGFLFGRHTSEEDAWAAENDRLEVDLGRLQTRLANDVGSETMLDALFQICQQRLVPLFPVISVSEGVGNGLPPDWYWTYFTRHDFNSTSPSPLPRIVKMIQCALPALSRTVPPRVRGSILKTLQTYLDDRESGRLGRTNSLVTVQLWLLLSMSEDLHAEDSAVATSILWHRLGQGIRGALDIVTVRGSAGSGPPTEKSMGRLHNSG